MNIRKLSFVEWVKILSGLLPYIGKLIQIAGVHIVDLIRGLIDIAGQVEELFPATIGPDGKPVKRGTEKREAFIAMVSAGFATAEEATAHLEVAIGPIADVLSGLLTAFGIFKKS